MDLVQIKLQGRNEDMSPEPSVSPDTSGTWDDFRDPEVLPRIGDEYQAEIPPFVIKSDDFRLLKNQTGGLHDIYTGLPVPVVWINDVQNLKQVQHNGSVNLVSASNQNEYPAVTEMQDVSETREIRPGDNVINKNLENVTSSADSKSLLQQEVKIKMNENNVDIGLRLVPDSLNDFWSDIEIASLLLGLYIFGKNLIQVKKFVGTKQMGDILSFYYGKFYRSEKYRRWSACRKVRGKRCICGQKLFTGWRQQELSSRLFSQLSEEKQNVVVEVSRRFTEGKILLEEYIFSLKATVGLNALVEAVGIGKGKQDLTSITMDPIKSNLLSRPEIPVGKACSMLTPVEILKFLTGDFRLSKARSNDLFWEAVWPRLLAKGWHSEQANSYSSTAGLKQSLVFLVPAVKKFCRRKQVKGDHYFDSVSDVLNKVASDPGLLELDNVEEKHGSDKEESELTGKTKQDQEDFPSPHRYCYLKPRTPVRSTDVMKFMVVDTSLANGKTFKIRELRSLPVEIMNTYASRSHSEDDEQVSSEVSMNDSHSDNSMHYGKEVIDISKAVIISLEKKNHLDEDNCVGSSSNQESPIDDLHSTNNISMKSQEDEKTLKDYSQQGKAVVFQTSKEQPDNEAELTVDSIPHWELNTCIQETSCNPINIFIGPELKQELSSSSDHDDSSQTVLPQVDLSRENLPSTSLSRGSPATSCVDVPPCDVVEVPEERHKPHTSFDLNLPIPQDPDNFESSSMEINGGQQNKPNVDSLRTFETPDISEHNSIKNSRRQSNRNRPPTTRALEAHALGLLDVKQKRKSRDVFLEENGLLRTSRHGHAKVRHKEKLGNSSIVDYKIEGRESNVCNDNGNMIHKLEV